mmetsp:Transcript_2407/g.4345  ORF Transcript_2407/g.4345 Transcript_2407/m.4345 type:complete len:1062 (+) Transcript_2407:50-3235(+)
MGGGCSAARTSDGGGAYDDPSPLTEAQIKRRIVASKHTEIMKVKTKHASFSIAHAYLTQRGYYPHALDKANQDSFCSHPDFNGEANIGFWGVFDGHGGAGDFVSTFTKKAIPTNLIKEMKSKSSDGSFESLSEQDIMKCHKKSFVKSNKEIAKTNFDTELSGTTAITVMIRGCTLFVNNVGDSRAVVAVRGDNGMLKAEHLSIDQTPFRKDERERVKKCGAIVMTIDQIEGLEPIHENWGINLGEEVDESGDPPRVWEQNMQRPGCAFTRSIGDHVAEKIGVFAEPEPLIRNIDKDTKFVVLASDGVWEFLTSQSVVDMVNRFEGPEQPLDACKSVVAESYRLWLQYEVRTDDITMIMLRIDDFVGTGPDGDESQGETASNRSTPSSTRRSTEKDIAVLKETAALGHTQRPVRRQLSKAKRRIIEERGKDIAKETENFVLADHISEKTKEEFARIEKHISTNFLFAHMTNKQKKDAVSCMEKVACNSGDAIIKQGEEGDKFYIVDSGTFDVLVRDDEGVMQTVFQYETPGSAFGELSLMYGKPRAATVSATSKGVLWAINRIAFRACMLKRNSHMDLIAVLKRVEILKSLTIPQLQRLCDCLAEESHPKGTNIFAQGDVGDALYIVEEGSLTVTKTGDGGKTTELMQLNKNDYFGERALMYEETRAANVIATTDIKLLTMNRATFAEVVGDLEQIIRDDQIKREGKIQRMSTYKALHSEKEVDMLKGASRDMFKVKAANDSGGGFSIDQGVFGTFALIKGKVPILYGSHSFNKSGVLECGSGPSHEKMRKLLSSFEKQSCFVPILLATFQSEKCCYSILKTPVVTDLTYLMGEGGKMNEVEAKFYLACLVLALEFLEKEGYMVRMISPSSIMISAGGFPVLSNLRFCKKMDGQRSFTMCGEQTYMAPEMITGEGYDFAVDSWGLGVLGSEMLLGSNMFGDASVQETVVFENISQYKNGDFRTTAKAARKDLTEDCLNTVDMLLSTDPARRLGGSGVSMIKASIWFEDINWVDLREQKVEPPHREKTYALLHEQDVKSVLEEFTTVIEQGGAAVTDPTFDEF